MGSLENIIKNLIFERPAIVSTVVGLGTFAYLGYNSNEYSSHLIKSLGPAYLTYLTASYTSEQHRKRYYKIKEKIDSSLTKIRKFVFGHSKPISVINGASLAYYFYLTNQSNSIIINNNTYSTTEYSSQIVLPMVTCATHLGFVLMNNYQMVKKGIKQERNKPKKSQFKRVWDFPFEHPIICGGIIGGLSHTNTYESRWEGTFQSLGYLVDSLLGSFSIMLTGGVLHSNSLAYLKNNIMKKVNYLFGNRRKAIEYQKKIVESSLSAVTSIEQRITLADLLLSTGHDLEALGEYRRATYCFSIENPNLILPRDFLLRVLLKKDPQLKNRFRRIAESFNEVVEYSPSKKCRRTFVFKRGPNYGELKREHDLNTAINSLLGEKRIARPKAPISISCCEYEDGLSYYVMLRNNNFSLEEILANRQLLPANEKLGLVTQALENLKIIHEEASKKIERGNNKHYLSFGEYKIELKKINYGRLFLERVLLGKNYDNHPRLGYQNYILGENPVLDDFMNLMFPYTKKLEIENDSFIHGDSGARHFLVDGTILDFEKAGIGNRFTDIAELLCDVKLDPQMIDVIINYYARDTKRKKEVREQLETSLLFHSLCRLGTASGRIALQKENTISIFEDRLDYTLTLINNLGTSKLKNSFFSTLEQGGLRDSSVIDHDRIIKLAKFRLS